MSKSDNFWNVPNVLTLSRLPLSIILFSCIEFSYWLVGLIVFLIAAATDWIDGWWARKFNQTSTFGRVFDPLTDKVLLGGAFIFLVAVPASEMRAWIAATVIGRELLVTGIRGYVESLGKKFGADWFGKLKTILQCVWLGAVLTFLEIRERAVAVDFLNAVQIIHLALLYLMAAATIGSGLQYVVKAIRILRTV